MPMFFDKSALVALKAQVDRLYGNVSRQRRAEMLQEALSRALEADPSLSGTVLAQRAIELLPQVNQAERDRLRRGGRIGDGAAAAMPQPIRRRSKRRPYMPLGLTPVLDPTGAHVVSVEVGDAPDAALIVATTRLMDELFGPTLRHEPIHPKKRAAVLFAYKQCFGGTPDSAWAAVLAQEIQKTKRSLVAARDAAARKDEAPPETTSIEFTKDAGGHARYPALPARFAANVRQVVRWTDGTRATIDLIGEIDGETRVLGHIVGTFEPAPQLQSTATPLTEAQITLTRAIQRAASFGGRVSLPEYVKDVTLIAWLIERAGFDGGGGVKALLSGGSLERLLLDAAELAAEVEAYAERHTERLDDASAEVAAANYAAMAHRIRRAASVGTPWGPTERQGNDE
jgi:hypothetical protein